MESFREELVALKTTLTALFDVKYAVPSKPEEIDAYNEKVYKHMRLVKKITNRVEYLKKIQTLIT